MEAKTVIFIDSNYWIYLFDQTAEEHTHVKAHFDKIYDQVTLAVNTVVMIEVMHYLIKRLGPDIGREKWELFSSLDFLVGDLGYDDLEGIFEVFSRYSHTGIGGRDATIISFMETNNVTRICSHDKDFGRIPSIERIDPIPE